jgi:hypothetical protein
MRNFLLKRLGGARALVTDRNLTEYGPVACENIKRDIDALVGRIKNEIEQEKISG